MLRMRALEKNSRLTVGAARALAARDVVLAAGMTICQERHGDYLLQVRRLLQEALASGMLSSINLETRRPAPNQSEEVRMWLEVLDHFQTLMPFFGLKERVPEL